MDSYDVVIVGARCAGSPLATMLARNGLSVCVVERAHFPSDTPSTHVIQNSGVEILRELGVLDAVLAAGAVTIEHVTVVYDYARIEAVLDGVGTNQGPGLCVRRIVLDELLADAAASAGAEVRTGVGVTGLIRDRDRVVGIETSAGPIRARLVIGADGVHSAVAKHVSAHEYHVSPQARMPAWAYFEGVPHTERRLRIGRIGDAGFLASPTDSGLYMIGLSPSDAQKRAFLGDKEGNFAEGVRQWPEIADLVTGATRIGPIRVMVDWHGFFRPACGPGWVLVGDAGHFKDPTPAQGISDALRQGVRLAAAVVAGLDGPSALDRELLRWWRWRDEDAYEMHWFATDMGAAGHTSPLIAGMLHDIAADTDSTNDLMRVLNHELRPSRLFGTRRLLRGAGTSIRRAPRTSPALAGEIGALLRTEIGRAVKRRRHTPRAA